MKSTLRALACLCLLGVVAQETHAQTRPRRATETPPPEKEAPKAPAPAANVREEVGEDEVVRVETTLVTIPVSVTDRQGRYIPDLTKEEFRVFEDGVEQEVAYFASTEKPFTVVLMLDTSSSVWGKLGKIKEAAIAFVEQLRPEDRVMVTSFAGGLTVHCEPTGDRERLRQCIKGIGKGMSTHLYDAVAKVMSKHLARLEGRKAVVLFTDGVDATSSDATYEETTRAAEELDAIIYAIKYGTGEGNVAPSPPQRPSRRLPGILGRIPIQIGTPGGGSTGSNRVDPSRAEPYMRELAELTGGRFYQAERDLRNLDQTFGLIAEELRRQYSLGYYARPQGGAGERRRVRVRVDRPDLAVRSRDSYIYRPAAGDAKTAGEKKSPPSQPPVLKKPFANVARAGRN
jgi:Ca-activated chloride channel family protein